MATQLCSYCEYFTSETKCDICAYNICWHCKIDDCDQKECGYKNVCEDCFLYITLVYCKKCNEYYEKCICEERKNE